MDVDEKPSVKRQILYMAIVLFVLVLVAVVVVSIMSENYNPLVKMGYFGPFWNFPYYPYEKQYVPVSYLKSKYYTPPLGQQRWKKYGLATALNNPLNVWSLQDKFDPITGLHIYRIVKGKMMEYIVQNRSLENEDVIWSYKNPDRPMVVSLVPY